MGVRRGFGIWAATTLLVVVAAACSPAATGLGPEPAADAGAEDALPQPAEPGSPPEPQSEVAPDEDLAPESGPIWAAIPLTDVRSGETFALSDFAGRVVVVETMAAWCPLCLDQAREIRQAQLRFGDEVAFVSLDIDPNESGDLLREHAARNGLGWRWAVAPRELARALADAFGVAILNPPSTPIVILDRGQEPHLLRFGIKPASELIQEIEAYLA